MSKSELRPLRFTRYFSVRLRQTTYDALTAEAKKRGFTVEHETPGNTKSGVTRLIREILEKYAATLDRQ